MIVTHLPQTNGLAVDEISPEHTRLLIGPDCEFAAADAARETEVVAD